MNRILIFLSVTVLICSCNKAKEESKPDGPKNSKAEISNNDSKVNGVTLRLSSEHFTVAQLKRKVLLIMKNSSEEAIMTGDNYHIERLNEGTWEMLEVFRELAFNSIGYMIPSGELKEFEISFLADKQRYTPGKYRVVKHYVKDADIAPKASYNLYFEFEVTP
ncbi:MAG: hypothetical protein EOP54_10635 [Sphingobacteriales bacterium]|nr:MAG: hypothetical protein EOP54_10635 [Sphingobacteriales bacterium]